MARRNRPVLYEIVRRSAEPGRPSFWRQRLWKPTDPGARPLPPLQVSPAAPPPVAPAPPSVSTEAARPRLSTAEGPRRASLRFDGQRIQIALGLPMAGIALLGLLAILIVAFQIGLRTGRAGAPAGSRATPTTEVAKPASDVNKPLGRLTPRSGAARPTVTPPSSERSAERSESPPREERLEPRRLEPAAPSAPPSAQPASPAAPAEPAFAPQEGHHYVVVQHFRRADESAARQAAEFLRSRGVACVLSTGPREIRIVATEPFLIDQKDARVREQQRKAAAALKQRIKELGKEYAREHGYAFDQCYEQKF